MHMRTLYTSPCTWYMLMIRKNLIKCKLNFTNTSGKHYFDSCMDSFCPEAEVCPCCNRKGDCVSHAFYKRRLLDFVNDRFFTSNLWILRVICSCGATHAILPDPIIPYRSYSLFFILAVLRDHFIHLIPIETVCDKYSISVKTFYRWKDLFNQHRKEWLGLLVSMELDERRSLERLQEMESFADFAIAFFLQTGISFLQSHKNPAPYRRSCRGSPDFFR